MGTAHLDRWLGGRLQEGAAQPGGLRRRGHSPRRGRDCRGSVREVPEWRAVTRGMRGEMGEVACSQVTLYLLGHGPGVWILLRVVGSH